MNKYFIVASLLLMSTQQIAFSMETATNQNTTIPISIRTFNFLWNMEDPQPSETQATTRIQRIIEAATITPTTHSPSLEDQIISLINRIINREYPKSFVHIYGIPQLTEQDFLYIISLINPASITPSNTLINKLCVTNQYCSQTITHFINLARENINNVTLDTLETITDPTLWQPTEKLNKLPLTMKTFVMDAAYNNIHHSYDMVLSGHTDAITFFDICTATHRIATSSKDNTLRLWDLETGQLIHQFPGDNNTVDYIAFSPDGSQLATAKVCRYPGHAATTDINLWETQSAQHLCVKIIDYRIDKLSYSTNNTLSAYYGPPYKLFRTVLSINNNAINILTDERLPIETSKHTQEYIFWGNLYKVKNPYNTRNSLGSTLTVTKQNCRPLALCEKAIKNRTELSSETIEQRAPFQKCTEYEQNMIREQQLKKTTSLIQAINSLTAPTNLKQLTEK